MAMSGTRDLRAAKDHVHQVKDTLDQLKPRMHLASDDKYGAKLVRELDKQLHQLEQTLGRLRVQD
jgi:hypothetical protein